MKISVEMTVWKLKELVTDKDHNVSNVSSDLEILSIPIVEVLISRIDKKDLFFCQLFFFLWFWRIDLVPQLLILEVQIPVSEKCYTRNTHHPVLSLD